MSCSAVIFCTNQRPSSKTRQHEHRRQAHTKARMKARTKAQKAEKQVKHKNESTRAQEHKSMRAKKHEREPKASETLCALITAAQRHYPESSTHRERAEKAGYPDGALLVWVLLTAIGRKICVGSYAG